MAEDWRVTVTLADGGGARLLEALREVRLEGAIRKRLEGRVSVSAGDAGMVFVYADEADALAERLRGEAPTGAQIVVEPSGGAIWEVQPANPFAIFGGMGV